MQKQTSLSLSLLAAPAVLSVAVLSTLFLFYNNTSAISDYSLSISTNTQTIEDDLYITPDSQNIYIQKQTITLNTDNPYGAKLYISSKNNQTTPKTTLSSGSGIGFSESTGTIENPAKLAANSFGFGLAKESSEITKNFSNHNTYEDKRETEKVKAKFAKLSSGLTEIYNKNTRHDNEKISVYYGENINSLIKHGDYEIDIVYTVVSNVSTNEISENNEDTMSIESKYAVDGVGGYERTIKTNLKSNSPISPDDINITFGGKPCSNIQIKQNFTTDTTKVLSITCQVPVNETGKYNVALKITKLGIDINKTNGIEYVQKMQDFDYAECNALSAHQSRILGDSRDGEIYTIAKLKATNVEDGKYYEACWMTQNLRLKLDSAKTLTEDDTDLGYGKESWTPLRSTELTLHDRWDKDIERYDTVRSYYDETKTENGVYYTFAAAVANAVPLAGYATMWSICPKNWSIPRFHGFNDLGKKYSKFSLSSYYTGVSELINGEPKYRLSGYRAHDSAKLKSVDSYGGWWTDGTAQDEASAYSMDLYSNYMSPKKSNYKYYGLNVRCTIGARMLSKYDPQ